MAYKTVYWDWREAFSKFGFDDGDGWNGTDLVAAFIREKYGVKVECQPWGCHNYMIQDVKMDGESLIPEGFEIGYEDPDGWMPPKWVEDLDWHFGDDYEAMA